MSVEAIERVRTAVQPLGPHATCGLAWHARLGPGFLSHGAVSSQEPADLCCVCVSAGADPGQIVVAPAQQAPPPMPGAAAAQQQQQAGVRSLLQAAASGGGGNAALWHVQIAPSPGSSPYVQQQIAALAARSPAEIAALLRSRGEETLNLLETLRNLLSPAHSRPSARQRLHACCLHGAADGAPLLRCAPTPSFLQCTTKFVGRRRAVLGMPLVQAGQLVASTCRLCSWCACPSRPLLHACCPNCDKMSRFGRPARYKT